jgi:hypothetical protein
MEKMQDDNEKVEDNGKDKVKESSKVRYGTALNPQTNGKITGWV